MYIIAGLGNPGAKFDMTRHNVGFMAIDLLAQRWGIIVNKIKHKALIGEGTIKGQKVVLIKPQTYMNLSGESLMDVVNWYKADIEKVIVIYDDIDIDFGRLRIRPSGSAGSHNGMKSIIYNLQKDNFPRIRIGIGKPPQNWDLANYVLQKFPKDDHEVLSQLIEASADAAETIVLEGVNSAMNKHNR